jgi:hypothetical protein
MYSQSKSIISFTVAPLGDLHSAEAYVAIVQANQVQRAFHFEFFHDSLVPVDKQRYRLPNSGYDLDAAVRQIWRKGKLPRPRPLILLTSLPYGERRPHQSIPIPREPVPMACWTWRAMCGSGRGVYGVSIPIPAMPRSGHSARSCKRLMTRPVWCGAARSTIPAGTCGAPLVRGPPRTPGAGTSDFGWCCTPDFCALNCPVEGLQQ